ncbi:MAG: sporulation transcriptional regulator SpoIIID [Christensenellaceae bacterium]
MWDYISERVKKEAEYIIATGGTVRSCAAAFGTSKSTVHKDVTERLMQINPLLHKEVRKILEKNLSERHIRGGIATREKYLSRKKRSEVERTGQNSDRPL